MRKLGIILSVFAVFGLFAFASNASAIQDDMSGYGGDAVSCNMHANPETTTDGTTTLIWNSSDNVVSAKLHPKNSSSWMQDVSADGWWWLSGITNTREYTLTVTGVQGQTASCDAQVIVEDVVEESPTCSIYANPGNIVAGGGINLIWNSSENVSKATLHPKNSSSWMQDVSANGSWWLSGIMDTREYTLTVETPEGETSTCDALVIVESEEVEPVSCNMHANPGVTTDGTTTLIWNSSDNVVSAKLHPKNSSSWMQDVSADGWWWLSGITNTREYTLTVTGVQGQTASCDAQVIVEEEVSSVPSCEINAIPDVVEVGGGTNLVWTSDDAVSAKLTPVGSNHIIGTFGSNGSWWLSGIVDSRSYLLTVEGADGEESTCLANIEVTPAVNAEVAPQ